MKRALLIILPLILILGGVAGGMFYMGVPPFKRPARKQVKKAASAASPPAQAASAPAPVSSVSPPPRPETHKLKPALTASLDTAEQEEARIVRLSSVYEQMPAEDAGRILAKLPDPLVEKLLRKMDERQVGKLLLAIDVNRAAKLTQSLAK